MGCQGEAIGHPRNESRRRTLLSSPGLTFEQVNLYTTSKINAEVQVERIRQLRKERGLSQAKLAVMADMDPATLNRLERGTGNPNLKTMHRVADALGVEIADFFPKAPRRSSPEPTFNDALEDERREDIYGMVLAAARRQAEQDRQAAVRAFESERPQTYFMRYENEVVGRLLEYAPDELAGALVVMARRCVQLEDQLKHITEAVNEPTAVTND